MEYKKKCNVCGKIFCYTDEDLKNNASNAGLGALSALGSLASTLGGGTIFHTHHLQGQADRYTDKIVDYNQCPYCHSRDLADFDGDVKTESSATNVQKVKTININTTASTESLMKRAFIFLEDGDWASADAYCEACLDRNPELADAYLGKLMAELHVKNQGELKNQNKPFDDSANYAKVVRYANDELKSTISGYIKHINAQNEISRKDEVLRNAKAQMTANDISGYEAAIQLFASISGWKDADKQRSICQRNLTELKTREKAARLERQRLAEAEKAAADAKAKRIKKMAIIIVPILAISIVGAILIGNTIKKSKAENARLEAYNAAVTLAEEGKYDEAIAAFAALGEYKDCVDRIIETREVKLEAQRAADYAQAESLRANGDYSSAIAAFSVLGDYKDSATQVLETKYQQALAWIDATKLLEAYEAFGKLGDYKDSVEHFSDFYFLPTGITLDNRTYLFSYDENAQMCCATNKQYSTTYEYSFTNGCVVSVKKIGKSENDSVFVWKEDGTVEEYKTGIDGVEHYFDVYGNCVSIRRANGEYRNCDIEIDEVHNVVKGINSLRISGSTSAKNYYDD